MAGLLFQSERSCLFRVTRYKGGACGAESPKPFIQRPTFNRYPIDRGGGF
jgi:hypothetical protein